MLFSFFLFFVLPVSDAFSNTSANTSSNNNADLIQRGLLAVNQQNYTLAIDFFKQVAVNNLTADEAALVHHNLGVCYYREGLYSNANTSFQQAMLSDLFMWRSVFNLALVAEKQQKFFYAEQLYQQIVAESSDTGLVAVAQTQKQKMSQLLSVQNAAQLMVASKLKSELASGLAAAAESERSVGSALHANTWSGDIFSSLGQDTNIIDPQNLNTSQSDDIFNEVYVGIFRPVVVNNKRAWLIDSKLYMQQYQSIDAFDITLMNVGLEHRWRFSRQVFKARMFIEHSSVGGDDYLLQQALQFSNRWQLGANSQWQVSYYFRNYIAQTSRFDALDGLRQELQLSWLTTLNNSHWQARLFVKEDNRENRLEFNRYTSFSSINYGIYGAWGYRHQRWYCLVDTEFATSDFDRPNTLADYSTKIRVDERIKVGASVRYELSARWGLSVEYDFSRNHSNIEKYSYRGSVASIGLRYSF